MDVTRGNNTVSFTQGGMLHTVTGFSARRGYDLASGVGTVNAALFVPILAELARLTRWRRRTDPPRRPPVAPNARH